MVGYPIHGIPVGIDVEMRRGDEQVDAVEFLAVFRPRLAVSSSMVSSGMIGSPSPEPLPTTPGQAALWSLG
jgi:hypothetical protein